MNTDISVLEKEIGYTFKNKELLLTGVDALVILQRKQASSPVQRKA